MKLSWINNILQLSKADEADKKNSIHIEIEEEWI